jgi:Cft2 family RNA processing exonuclease
VSALEFQHERGGIHLPALGLWLDPSRAQTGAELVFVSHAHSDHIAAHREVILTAPTARFLQARLGGKRVEHVLPFGQPSGFRTGRVQWTLTLLPAGHILGSAMALIEVGRESLLFTGDFKLRRGLVAEPCEPRRADALIMETTFGRPEYRFPPAARVRKDVIGFCHDAIEAEATPILLGYSLGKAQELLRGLTKAGLPILLHPAVHQLTRIHEAFGQTFPKYRKFEGEVPEGHVVIAPPTSDLPATLGKAGKVRSAVATGWALDSSCRYRYGTDAAFPLSDHADFPELLRFVKRVAPKRVFTHHGFAADFAWTLRDLGFDARVLGGPEQLTLPLRALEGARHRGGDPQAAGAGKGAPGIRAGKGQRRRRAPSPENQEGSLPGKPD